MFLVYVTAAGTIPSVSVACLSRGRPCPALGLPLPLVFALLSQVKRVLSEYKIHNCEVLVRQDVTIDDIVDVVQGNRK